MLSELGSGSVSARRLSFPLMTTRVSSRWYTRGVAGLLSALFLIGCGTAKRIAAPELSTRLPELRVLIARPTIEFFWEGGRREAQDKMVGFGVEDRVTTALLEQLSGDPRFTLDDWAEELTTYRT